MFLQRVQPIFNEVKGESRMEKQRSLVATLCRDDKHTIIFTLLSTKPSTDPLPYGTPPNLEGEFLISICTLFSVLCYLCSVICTLFSVLYSLLSVLCSLYSVICTLLSKKIATAGHVAVPHDSALYLIFYIYI